MLTEYELLTQVKFRHSFFSNTKLECFTVQPDLTTKTLFLKSGILFRALSDGFALFYNSFDNGEVIRKAEVLDASVLRFEIILNDPYFFNYTLGESRNQGTSLYFFTNAVNDENLSKEYLQKSEFVSVDDAIEAASFDQQFFKKPFGIIDIQLHKELVLEYFLNFKEKESYWRYIISGDYLKNLSQLAIIGDDIAFEGPTKITLPNEKEALSFVSTLPINHQQKPKQYFKLVDYYEKENNSFKVIINTLPIPDTTHISSSIKNTDDSKHYSEIFIY